MRLFAAVALVQRHVHHTVYHTYGRRQQSSSDRIWEEERRRGTDTEWKSLHQTTIATLIPMQKLRLHGRVRRDDGGTIRTFCVNCTVLVKRLGYNTNLFASTFTFGDTSGGGCRNWSGEGGVASRVRIRGGVGVRSKEEGEGMGALLEVGKAVEGIWTLAASERERGFHMS